MSGAIPIPGRLSCTTVRLGEDDLLLIEFPLPTPVMPPGLTPTECAVVRLLLDDRSPQQIARLRGSSVNTVRNHIRSVHRKLGVSTTSELVQTCFASPRDRA